MVRLLLQEAWTYLRCVRLLLPEGTREYVLHRVVLEVIGEKVWHRFPGQELRAVSLHLTAYGRSPMPFFGRCQLALRHYKKYASMARLRASSPIWRVSSHFSHCITRQQ